MMSDLWRTSFDSLRRGFEASAERYPKLFYAVAMSARSDELELRPTLQQEWKTTWSLGTGLTPVAAGAVQFSTSHGNSLCQKWCVFAREQFNATLEAFQNATFDELAGHDWKARLVDKPLSEARKAFKDLANTAGRCLLTLPSRLVPVYPLSRVSDRHREDFTWRWLNQLLRWAWQHPGSALHARRSVWMENDPQHPELPGFDPWSILTYTTADHRTLCDWRIEAQKQGVPFPDVFMAQLTEDIFRSSVFGIDLLFHLAENRRGPSDGGLDTREVSLQAPVGTPSPLREAYQAIASALFDAAEMRSRPPKSGLMIKDLACGLVDAWHVARDRYAEAEVHLRAATERGAHCAHQEALNAICGVNDACGHVMLGVVADDRASAHLQAVPAFDLRDLLEAMRHQTSRATLELQKAVQPSLVEAGIKVTAEKPKASRRSTAKGEARTKIISALAQHHHYDNGSCLFSEPIGVNQLAGLADVGSATVSGFFNTKFNEGEKGGHAKYRRACRNGKLGDSLKLLLREFPPSILFQKFTRADEVESPDD